MNRNECERHLCTLLNWANLTNAKPIFIQWKKKYGKNVVETQVLGVKPPQSCKKISKYPKVWGYEKKKKKDQKFGDAKKG